MGPVQSKEGEYPYDGTNITNNSQYPIWAKVDAEREYIDRQELDKAVKLGTQLGGFGFDVGDSVYRKTESSFNRIAVGFTKIEPGRKMVYYVDLRGNRTVVYISIIDGHGEIIADAIPKRPENEINMTDAGGIGEIIRDHSEKRQADTMMRRTEERREKTFDDITEKRRVDAIDGDTNEERRETTFGDITEKRRTGDIDEDTTEEDRETTFDDITEKRRAGDIDEDTTEEGRETTFDDKTEKRRAGDIDEDITEKPRIMIFIE